MSSVRDTHYIIGSVVGPHPFPMMVRDFQAIIGREARTQIVEMAGRLPDACVACVGGGSNAAGAFHPFVEDTSVELIGVEAGGRGTETGLHAATLKLGWHGGQTTQPSATAKCQQQGFDLIICMLCQQDIADLMFVC